MESAGSFQVKVGGAGGRSRRGVAWALLHSFARSSVGLGFGGTALPGGPGKGAGRRREEGRGGMCPRGGLKNSEMQKLGEQGREGSGEMGDARSWS